MSADLPSGRQLDDVDAPRHQPSAPGRMGSMILGKELSVLMTITVIGLNLAKSVSQAHGVDDSGRTVLVKKL
jgi:hypothetical protein